MPAPGLYLRLRERLLPGLGNPEDRGLERIRRARLAGLAALAARGSSIFTLIVLVPAARAELGPERFGLWMLLSSLTMVLSFADLGIGNGILNEISAARGRDDVPRMRRVVTAGFVLLGGAAMVFGLIAALIGTGFDWARVFNVKSALAVGEARNAVLVFAGCFVFSLVGSVPGKVQSGLQEGLIANGLIGLGNVCAFIAVMLGLRAGWGIPSLVALLFGIPAAIQLLAMGPWFAWKHRELVPNAASLDLATLRRLARSGFAFFIMQVFTVATSRLDAFFVAGYAGAADAGLYSASDRLFSVASIVPISFLFPLWPAYREALHRGDVDWVRHTLVQSMVQASGVTAAVCLPVLLWPDHIFSLWFHTRVDVPGSLTAGFTFWKIVEALGSAGAMLMNGAGRLRAATGMLGAMAVCSLIAKALLVPHFGAFSVVWITAAAWTVFCVLPLAWFVPRILHQFRQTHG